MDTLADHTPEIELYSIDEAFLNLAGFERRGLAEYARQIRATVRRHTGIAVSIGIGPTKTLAKIVNHVAKAQPERGGVYDLSETDVDQALASVDVGEVWGVGRRWAIWLEDQGLTTALDLKRADPKAIRRKTTVVGERLVCELNGRSCPPLELVAPPRQGLTVSHSFGQPLTRLGPIKEALVQFVGRAEEKLRRQRLMASQVMVFVTTNRSSATSLFYANSTTVKLPYPTDFTPDLVEAAAHLIETLYRPGVHYQKCGVMLLDLSPVPPAGGAGLRLVTGASPGEQRHSRCHQPGANHRQRQGGGLAPLGRRDGGAGRHPASPGAYVGHADHTPAAVPAVVARPLPWRPSPP